MRATPKRSSEVYDAAWARCHLMSLVPCLLQRLPAVSVKGNDAAARDLAKVLRAEAKRHNSAKAAAAFAEGGGAAAAVAAVESSDYWDDANRPDLRNRIKAATDSLAALADLAAAGGAAHAAVIGAGAADSDKS